MTSGTITAQLAFLSEIDHLKTVLRASRIANDSRQENSAEHSWHLAMFALVLSDHAAGNVDIQRVIKMLLIHDIVEIDAGDWPLHQARSAEDTAAHAKAEAAAAARLFGLLPAPMNTALETLWHEFEAAQTADAQFAKALDRLQPVILNLHTDGGTWSTHEVSEAQLYDRLGPVISLGSPALWDHIKPLIAAHFAQQSG